MKFERLEYLVALSKTPQTLIIDTAGDATFTSYTNAQTPERPEIGVYRTVLPASEITSLERLLATPPVADLPDHSGRVLSGDQTRLLKLALKTQTIAKFVGTTEPVDQNLDRDFAKLDTVVHQVQQHPLAVLQFRIFQSALDPSGTLRLNAGFSNLGIQTLYCRNPQDILDAEEAMDGRLIVNIWPDKPLSQLEADDIVALKVQEVKQLFVHEKVVTSQGVVEIPPGGWIQFEFSISCGLKTTDGYVIRATYANELHKKTTNGKPLIVGEILSRLSP